MQELNTAVLDRVPPPAEVRRRLEIVTREATTLRKLLRLAKQIHGAVPQIDSAAPSIQQEAADAH